LKYPFASVSTLTRGHPSLVSLVGPYIWSYYVL
jgi:hypothetical protein